MGTTACELLVCAILGVVTLLPVTTKVRATLKVNYPVTSTMGVLTSNLKTCSGFLAKCSFLEDLKKIYTEGKK